MSTCFFIGSRHAPSSIKEVLIEVTEKHITDYNVTTFTVGHYGGFDSLVISALKELKKKYTNINLYLLFPYALTQKSIEIPDGFSSIYPDGLEHVPLRLAIVQANMLSVRANDYLIAYPSAVGNSRKICEYAQKLEKKGLIKKVTVLQNLCVSG